MLKIKNKLSFFVILTILHCSSGYNLYSQDNSASLNSNIYATILTKKPGDLYSIQKLIDLNFGVIAVTSSSGSFSINPQTNVSTSTGGVVPQPSLRTRAEFLVKGKQNQPFTISVNQSSIVLQNTQNSANTVTVNLTNFSIGYFSNVGEAHFYVGGTLNVDANQPKGTYTGTFVVNLNNN
ncbi:DUF4402 domain-containing protein [Bacteroidales bacterium MB20-C3-3]|nr:DUF4402 domain-containing protein [Bacteroidales bacterium MB20-C3-3]